MADFDPCDFLFSRWKTLALWRNLWTILIFLLGAAFMIFLVAAVLFFIKQSWVVAALSTFGTIANGVGVAWIVARRDQAVTEETEAKNELLQKCGGATGGMAMADGTTKTRLQAVEEVERQLKLFGAFR